VMWQHAATSQWGEGQVLLHERKFSPVSIIPLVLHTELHLWRSDDRASWYILI